MTLKEQLNTNLKDAMRARDQKTLDVLRLVTAAIKQIEVDERISVDDERLVLILDKMVKQRKESITHYESAGRDDLLAQEMFELNLISEYLPTPLTDSEINQAIDDAFSTTSASKIADMGRVMAILKPQLQGRADMATVSARIKAKLG
jgi:uncharacterized protein YqeY